MLGQLGARHLHAPDPGETLPDPARHRHHLQRARTHHLRPKHLPDRLRPGPGQLRPRQSASPRRQQIHVHQAALDRARRAASASAGGGKGWGGLRVRLFPHRDGWQDGDQRERAREEVRGAPREYDGAAAAWDVCEPRRCG